VTRLRTGRTRFGSQKKQQFFLFTTAWRPTLRSTQPLIRWIPGALSPGIKLMGCEADHSPQSSAKLKESVELHLHPAIRFRGVVLN